MEDITLSWLRLTCPALACRHAGTMGAEDVSNLQLAWPTARSVTRSVTSAFDVQRFERFKRAGRVPDRFGGDMGVARRRAQLGVARATPGSPAHPFQPPADASQSCAGAYAAWRAWKCPPDAWPS